MKSHGALVCPQAVFWPPLMKNKIEIQTLAKTTIILPRGQNIKMTSILFWNQVSRYAVLDKILFQARVFTIFLLVKIYDCPSLDLFKVRSPCRIEKR